MDTFRKSVHGRIRDLLPLHPFVGFLMDESLKEVENSYRVFNERKTWLFEGDPVGARHKLAETLVQKLEGFARIYAQGSALTFGQARVPIPRPDEWNGLLREVNQIADQLKAPDDPLRN